MSAQTALMIRVWGAMLVVMFLFPGTALALGDMGDHFACSVRLGVYVQHECQLVPAELTAP